MMKRKAILVSILLVFSLMVGILATGCSVKGTTTGTSSSTTAGTSSNPIQLIWLMYGGVQKDEAMVWNELNKMSKEAINVTVETKHYDADKLSVALASGEYYDMCFTCEWFNDYGRQAQAGYYADITEKIKTVTPDLYKFIPEVVWKGSMINGKLYAIPVYKDSAAAQYWMFDKATVERLNIDITKATTMDSLTPILKKIKEDKPDEYPIMLGKGGLQSLANEYDYLIREIGLAVPYTGGSTKVICIWEDEYFLNKLRVLHSWYVNGYINPDAPIRETAIKYSAVDGLQGFPGADAIMTQVRQADGYGPVVINKFFGPVYSTSSIRGAMNAISAGSKYVDAALKYFEYINLNHEYRDMLAYGIKGVHYELTPEGTVNVISSNYCPPAWSQATFFTMTPTAPAPKNMWEMVKKEIDNAPGSPLLGFSLNVSGLETQIAACTTIVNKYITNLYTGAADPDVEIPKLMEELYAAGYKTIVENAQSQVDAFLKQNK
ncbi:MAG: ABC transporter substrate-binding protein [Firmicutes bacterium]|nr:ABC transporter substrate-binding protein [Bacillota bacterium]